MTDTVRDNPALQRFELDVDGHIAVACYTLMSGVMTFTHTEVPPALAGRGVGSALARGALETARSRELRVAATCPFVSAYIAKHPEFADLLV
jgi:predicted GNAT family acetyltransferase